MKHCNLYEKVGPLTCTVSAKARRIPEFVVKLSTDDFEPVICSELSDFQDYCQPLAKGALLKTVLLYTKTIRLDSSLTLAEQLKEKIGSGIEITCRTDLPQGLFFFFLHLLKQKSNSCSYRVRIRYQ